MMEPPASRQTVSMNAEQSVRICVPICERSLAAMELATAVAKPIGDLIEFRIDCVDSLEPEIAIHQIEGLIAAAALPTIVTFRASEQGGRHNIGPEARNRFWRVVSQLGGASFLDLELDLVENLSSSASPAYEVDWTRVICSHHDFQGVPSDLDDIYRRMARTRARILKIAFQANDITDCIPAFRLLEKAKEQGREIMVMAMGPSGTMTRILGPSRGSFLTYGSADDASATAPGQITADDLKNLYRIDKVDQHTRVMGVVGFPVAHSFSPRIHNAAFAATDLNAVYVRCEVGDVASFITRLVHPRSREVDLNICGLSVTTPHKATVIDYLDFVDTAAKEIGAVNTIVVTPEGLRGYNTDASAFIKTLVQRVGSVNNAKCAVIGSGGAARAVVWGLTQENAHTTVFARNIEKGNLLAKPFEVAAQSLSGARFREFDVVVNATVLGMSGKNEGLTPVTADQLRGARAAYDLVYNPSQTQFLTEARAAGCETIGGLDMLVAQAGEQYKLWTGADPPEPVMKVAAIRALG